MDKFEELRQKVNKELNEIKSTRLLGDLKARFMGKNGEITALLRGMKDVPNNLKAEFGKK